MDKKLGGLLLVFFLLFTVFVTIVLLNKQLITFTRAKEDYVPSAKTSLLFGFPLLVKADGTTKSTVNIFVRSDKGMPVKSQKMTVTTSFGTLSETQVTTDDTGKASTTITSSAPGTAKIQALIDGVTPLSQTLSIKFE